MTTKNEQPTRLAQMLERPEADQGYPVWEEARVWAKVEALAEKPPRVKWRKYWLWGIAFGILWSTAGAERLEMPEKAQPAPFSNPEPIAKVELKLLQDVAPISIPAPKVGTQSSVASPTLVSEISSPPTSPDSTYNNMVVVLEKIEPFPALPHLGHQAEVLTLPKSILPPQPWRKKYSTLYTLKVPEIPFDWDMRNGFVQRLERQLKFDNQPRNGWIAFQVHWDSGTAFTLVHQSRDSIPTQHPTIQLHHTKH